MTIAGMSGGPVFGMWFSDDRRTFDYTVVGIQSGWDSKTLEIAAWPVDELAYQIALQTVGNLHPVELHSYLLAHGVTTSVEGTVDIYEDFHLDVDRNAVIAEIVSSQG